MILSQWLEDELEEGRRKQREEAMEEGIAEGRKEGIAQGEKSAVVSIICSNLAKGMNCSDIATFIQKDVKFVENIKKIGENTVPIYDVEQIISKI